MKNTIEEEDLEARKRHHLEMASQSQKELWELNGYFDYEPLLEALPERNTYYQREFSFLKKTMRAPLWISSMTGGTQEAKLINHHLAKVCSEFGLGMGLGSCRPLLLPERKKEVWPHFHLRPLIGKDLPLMGNIGIAQVEKLLRDQKEGQLEELVSELDLDGLFVHINPLQEYLQPEGDPIFRPPLETLQEFLEKTSYPVAIKEVGQGMGPLSLRAAIQLPLAVIEFAAFGGTNFTSLEMQRSSLSQHFAPLAFVGHSVQEMVCEVNHLLQALGPKAQCREFIISGGVSSFLHGLYLIRSLKGKAVYGQAYSFLRKAQEGYASLRAYVKDQLFGLELANRYLKLKKRSVKKE